MARAKSRGPQGLWRNLSLGARDDHLSMLHARAHRAWWDALPLVAFHGRIVAHCLLRDRVPSPVWAWDWSRACSRGEPKPRRTGHLSGRQFVAIGSAAPTPPFLRAVHGGLRLSANSVSRTEGRRTWLSRVRARRRYGESRHWEVPWEERGPMPEISSYLRPSEAESASLDNEMATDDEAGETPRPSPLRSEGRFERGWKHGDWGASLSSSRRAARVWHAVRGGSRREW